MTTLRDVAREAGVSVGTASNAFNRPDAVSDDARRRVEAAASALGYRGPDPAARRLRTGRSGAIGVVFTDSLSFAFEDLAATAFLRGVAEGLEGSGAGLLIVPTSPSREAAARVAAEAVVDGVIAYSTPTGDPRLTAVRERGLPVIVVDQPRDTGLPFVGIDDRRGARRAAAHLAELGRERVAVLAFGHTAEHERLPFDVTRERLDGYRDGLGAAWDERRVVRCRPNSPAVARETVRDLLAGDDPPDAILAMSDALAVGALRAAREAGVAVPGELSVVGFDDSPLAALAEPPLTTVRQPLEEKGRIAAQVLLRAIEGEPAPARTLLETALVRRATTG